MAKNPNLTVSVNSQQFQQFAKQFATFSGQMKQMNQQFAQINTALQKTTITARMLNASFQVGLNVLKGIGSVAGKITGHFLKWSVIIGGVTTLLGMGGGLFGIDRLAQSILAKRRQVLGLGGSANYGRVQASTIYNQSYLDNPMGSLQAVQRGLGGSSDEMRGLAAAGIPFGTKMSPTEVLDKIIDKTMDVVKHAAPGTELMVTKAYGLDKFVSESDIMRMATEEGREEIKYRREQIKAHEKELQISPRALKGWADLELQLQIAGASMRTIFGEKLRDLAKPLGDLSEGFVHLIKILMDSPTIQKIMKKLADGIEWLADQLKLLTDDDIKAFVEAIKGWLPTMEEFKTAMKGFVDVLQGAIVVLRFLNMTPAQLKDSFMKRANELPAGAQFSKDPAGTVRLGPAGQAIWDKIHGALINPLATTPSTAAPATPAPATPVPTTPAPTSPAPTTQAPAATQNAPGFGGGASSFQRFGMGGGGGSYGQPGASNFSWMQSAGVPAPGLGAGTMPPGDWSGAASKMVPPANGSSRSQAPVSNGQKTSMRGPLSSDNWQMTRTASLVVRNVPGSNIFMSAQGMTG